MDYSEKSKEELIKLIRESEEKISFLNTNLEKKNDEINYIKKDLISEKIRTKNDYLIFNEFMKNSPVYIFFKDSEIRPINLSRNYEKMIGMPLEQILGKTMDEIFPSDLAKSMIADDKKIIQEGKTIEVEEEFGGKHYYTIKFPIKLDNKTNYLAGFTIDLSEQKKTEEELIIFKEAIENSTDAIGFSTKDGELFYQNKSFSNLFGDIGKNPPETLYVDKSEGHQVFNTIMKGEKWEGVVEMYSAEKKILKILLRAYPVKDDSGKVKVLLGVHTDITENVKKENLIKEQNLKLQELNNTKDKFFSIIAHDLKNPFGSILNITQQLHSNFDDYDSETLKKFISLIYQTTDKTYKLLDNLLTWAKSQTGTISYNPSLFNFNTIIHETINLLKNNADAKQISISTNLIDNEVFADIEMCKTILRNLISNAIKFTEKGGRINISTDISEEKNLLFKIEDTGVGLKEDIVNDIFDISKKTSSYGTENETGTGLGLILCKEFTEKQNGKIWCKSQVGKGTSFYITLPRINSDGI